MLETETIITIVLGTGGVAAVLALLAYYNKRHKDPPP